MLTFLVKTHDTIFKFPLGPLVLLPRFLAIFTDILLQFYQGFVTMQRICTFVKAVSKKHRNRKILEFGVLVFAIEMVEKAELKQQLLPANRELESGCLCRTPTGPVQALKVGPEAESVVASKGDSCRIKLVMTKQQLRELVSKRISVQDIIEVQKASYRRPELESIPEENEIGCFL
ncbi:hypothetical protein L6452_04502 [Arctium lappa]|uniref:Uncharacterized protein n=1 Tax=Arctium lappa TaxID=4217 RepID=A0ACB9EE53_ARCLA|nr:hypothetical protein L6452_04502 [Arctium lappa]